MPFSLVDARACFDREASVVAQVISSTIPSVCLSWTKKKQTNRKNLAGLINEKETSPGFKKRHSLSYHSKESCAWFCKGGQLYEASTLGTDALMSKNNDSLSSRQSETQVVGDCAK